MRPYIINVSHSSIYRYYSKNTHNSQCIQSGGVVAVDATTARLLYRQTFWGGHRVLIGARKNAPIAFIIDNYFKNVATGFGDKPRQWFTKWRNILSKIVCELNDGLPMSHLFRLKVNINQPQNARFILYIISTHFENPLWMNIRCMSKNQRYNYQSKPAHQQQFYSTTQK